MIARRLPAYTAPLMLAAAAATLMMVAVVSATFTPAAFSLK
jgi:hypothetical protein